MVEQIGSIPAQGMRRKKTLYQHNTPNYLGSRMLQLRYSGAKGLKWSMYHCRPLRFDRCGPHFGAIQNLFGYCVDQGHGPTNDPYPDPYHTRQSDPYALIHTFLFHMVWLTLLKGGRVATTIANSVECSTLFDCATHDVNAMQETTTSEMHFVPSLE